MSNKIHNTAIIHERAQIDASAEIGPYCVIGEHVKIAAGVKLYSHIVVDGHTSIDEGTTIYPFASIGTPPQDLKFSGEISSLTIGKNNTIREHVTMNPGTKGGGLETIIGDNCLFMVASHVAHDCKIGNNVILANNATLAGHVEVGNNAIIGGLAAIHQFVRIGHNAIIGGMSGVVADVIPYASVSGERANLAGLNLIGLKRSGINRKSIHAIRNAYKDIFDSEEGTLADRAKAIREKYADFQEVIEITDFLISDSTRSFCTPKTE